MNDTTTEIDSITRKIHSFIEERDWRQFHNPKDLAAAISIEASELLEHFLWKSSAECQAHIQSHRQDVSDEIADIAIYLFELADNLGIGLVDAMESKMAKNAIKYPVEKAKGRHAKYTEL